MGLLTPGLTVSLPLHNSVSDAISLSSCCEVTAVVKSHLRQNLEIDIVSK